MVSESFNASEFKRGLFSEGLLVAYNNGSFLKITPLHVAVLIGDKEIVSYLLDCLNNNPDIVASPDTSNLTPLGLLLFVRMPTFVRKDQTKVLLNVTGDFLKADYYTEILQLLLQKDARLDLNIEFYLENTKGSSTYIGYLNRYCHLYYARVEDGHEINNSSIYKIILSELLIRDKSITYHALKTALENLPSIGVSVDYPSLDDVRNQLGSRKIPASTLSKIITQLNETPGQENVTISEAKDWLQATEAIDESSLTPEQIDLLLFEQTDLFYSLGKLPSILPFTETGRTRFGDKMGLFLQDQYKEFLTLKPLNTFLSLVNFKESVELLKQSSDLLVALDVLQRWNESTLLTNNQKEICTLLIAQANTVQFKIDYELFQLEQEINTIKNTLNLLLPADDKDKPGEKKEENKSHFREKIEKEIVTIQKTFDQVNLFAAEIRKNLPEIADFQIKLTQLHEQIAQSKSHLDELTKTKQQLAENITTQSNKFNETVNAIAQQTEQLARNIDSSMQKADKLEEQNQSIEKNIQTVKKELDGLVNKMTSLKQELAKRADITNNIDKLKKKNKKLKQQINNNKVTDENARFAHYNEHFLDPHRGAFTRQVHYIHSRFFGKNWS